MSQRRQLRSDKDVTLTRLEDTPKSARRKSSVKNNPLTSTPSKRESTETAKRLSSSFVKQQSRQDHEMENADQSILSNSLLINNNNISRFDDKPEHLYGLDNPADISNDRERVELKYKTGDAHDKPVNKICQLSICFLACFCFCLLVIWTGINMNQHNEKQQDKAEKQQMKLEIKLLKDQLKEVKHMLSDHWLKSNQDHTFQKVFLRDQSAPITEQHFQELIDKSLRRWDADKIGLADYALESTGGQIHSSYHSATFANGAPQVLLFGIPLWHDVKTPRVVIQPGNSPGECWAFQGRTGFVVIKLSQMIKPSSFTLEHMPASLSQFGDQSIPSAPKEFSVWGWSDAHGNEKTLLGEHVFDNKGHALQRFPVQATAVSEYRFIELKVHSNYGNPSYTCLYRFRVHGSPHRNNN